MKPIGILLTALTILVLILGWAKTQGILLIEIDRPFDLATLLLVAATLVVTGVGVAAALVTFWGFAEIKAKAIEAATKEAKLEAAKVAKEVAQLVAARTVFEATGSATVSAEQSKTIVDSLEPDGAADAAGH